MKPFRILVFLIAAAAPAAAQDVRHRTVAGRDATPIPRRVHARPTATSVAYGFASAA